MCCVRENQDAEIYFFCPSLPWKYKGKFASTKLVQHTSDSYGRGYVGFAHFLYLEASSGGASNEYRQHMFSWTNKNIFPKAPLIWRYGFVILQCIAVVANEIVLCILQFIFRVWKIVPPIRADSNQPPLEIRNSCDDFLHDERCRSKRLNYSLPCWRD